VRPALVEYQEIEAVWICHRTLIEKHLKDAAIEVGHLHKEGVARGGRNGTIQVTTVERVRY
jgi:hypothetical protein